MVHEGEPLPTELAPAADDLYRRLQRNLDRMPVPFPATSSGIEIRILQRLFTREEASAALALSMIPEPAEVIADRLGEAWPVGRLEPLHEEMARKGVIERIRAGDEWRYAKSMLAIGIYERQLPHLTAELQQEVDQYFAEGFGEAFHSGGTTQMRTVPVRLDVTPERGVASYDDIRAFVRQSDGPFAVMDCICRKGRELVGEECRQTKTLRTCLTIGPAARGMAESGVAEMIGKEWMLHLLDRADEEGLVLQPQNTAEPWFVCCCCGCCCGVLRSAKQLAEPVKYFSTNYIAESDVEQCAGCGVCVERCQMDAVTIPDGVSVIDEGRCIGCGLCVSTCTTGGMRLRLKESPKAPPADVKSLYLKMYRERYGVYETAKALGKAMMRRQV